MVEFEVAEAGEQFARIEVLGNDDAALNTCVGRVLSAVRFAPTTAQIFHEEYLP